MLCSDSTFVWSLNGEHASNVVVAWCTGALMPDVTNEGCLGWLTACESVSPSVVLLYHSGGLMVAGAVLPDDC